MPKKKKEEQNYNEMAVEELGRELEKSRSALFKLKFRAATAPVKNVMEIQVLKREIARINTFINQKRKQTA